MKTILSPQNRRRMLPVLSFILLMLTSLTWFGFHMAEEVESGILETLGLSEEVAGKYVFDSFERGYPVVSARIGRKIAAGDRAAAMREVCAYVKSYTQSDDFRKRWQDYRESYRPKPNPTPMDPAIVQMQRENLTTVIQQYEQIVKDMPDELKGQFEAALTEYRLQLKEVDDPYAGALRRWEAQYPASPDSLIRERLKAFIGVAETVNFDAKLVEGSDGIRRFADPAYENQSGDWKQCYRAGREATNIALAFSREWLAELQ